MPKSSLEQYEIDRKKVIEELIRDAKQSVDRIGKNCGFSRQKVWRIIKQLEKNNTIWGYSAVVDSDILDLKRYLILIKKTNKPLTPDKIDIITSRKLKEVTSQYGITIENSFYTHGSSDWFISVTARGIKDIKRVVEMFTYMLKDFIEQVDVIEVIFPVALHNCPNPNIEKIKDFFI
jgi:DNA-binding Lrp family transcriptional regulator